MADKLEPIGDSLKAGGWEVTPPSPPENKSEATPLPSAPQNESPALVPDEFGGLWRYDGEKPTAVYVQSPDSEPFWKRYLRSYWKNYDRWELPKAQKEIVDAALELDQGIYWHGPNSVGKTGLLVQAFAYLCEKFAPAPGEPFRSTGAEVLISTVSDLLDEFRKDIGRARALERDENRGELASPRFLNCKYLLLDDLGASATTAWGTEQLLLLINQRERLKLPVFYTSNYDLNRELPRVLNEVYDPDGGTRLIRNGDRIVERITGTCEVVAIDGPNLRERRVT